MEKNCAWVRIWNTCWFLFVFVFCWDWAAWSGNCSNQIVFSRWCLHNEYTMSLSSTPCLNAWKQQSPTQVLFLHAYDCCCHSCSCLSLAFCVLKLLIYSSSLPGTLHLICDEGTGAGDKMFPYYGYIKLNFFLYNVCMKRRCLLALEAFISSFAEREKRREKNSCLL